MAIDSKRLVIDASVARAAGGKDAQHPVAVASREFLETVLTVCHKVVMTPPMQKEWNLHQSRFARKWRSGMVARKKLVAFCDDQQSEFRQAVGNLNVNEKCKQAMLKDCHLIEAAFGNDYSVISLDDKAKDLFSSVSNNLHELKQVLWVNPGHQESVLWLKSGAPNNDESSQHWKLGI